LFQNFEDFVVEHFISRAHDIMVAERMKALFNEFIIIGAMDCEISLWSNKKREQKNIL